MPHHAPRSALSGNLRRQPPPADVGRLVEQYHERPQCRPSPSRTLYTGIARSAVRDEKDGMVVPHRLQAEVVVQASVAQVDPRCSGSAVGPLVGTAPEVPSQALHPERGEGIRDATRRGHRRRQGPPRREGAEKAGFGAAQPLGPGIEGPLVPELEVGGAEHEPWPARQVPQGQARHIASALAARAAARAWSRQDVALAGGKAWRGRAGCASPSPGRGRRHRLPTRARRLPPGATCRSPRPGDGQGGRQRCSRPTRT